MSPPRALLQVVDAPGGLGLGETFGEVFSGLLAEGLPMAQVCSLFISCVERHSAGAVRRCDGATSFVAESGPAPPASRAPGARLEALAAAARDCIACPLF